MNHVLDIRAIVDLRRRHDHKEVREVSHFSRIKTQMVEREFLVAALRDLGYVPEEGRVQVRGFAGNRTPVDIKVPTRNSGYDIGFRRVGEAFEMVADWWGIRDSKRDEFMTRLLQRYAYNAARKRLEAQGFTLVREDMQPDGQLHLVLRRAS